MQRISILIYIAAMLIAAASQILLKMSAVRQHPNRLKEYLNRHVAAAYGMSTLAMIMALYAYKFIPMSLAPILESSAVIFVAVLGRAFLGEKINGRKLAGIAVMIAGIIIVSLDY